LIGASAAIHAALADTHASEVPELGPLFRLDALLLGTGCPASFCKAGGEWRRDRRRSRMVARPKRLEGIERRWAGDAESV